MKKFAVLSLLVLALASVASANTIHIRYGYGTLYAQNGAHYPYYTFTFYAGRYVVTAGPEALDSLMESDGLQHCTPCDPTRVGTLLMDSGITLHEDKILAGVISFEAINFHSTLLGDGRLRVKYQALPYISLVCAMTGTAVRPMRDLLLPNTENGRSLPTSPPTPRGDGIFSLPGSSG